MELTTPVSQDTIAAFCQRWRVQELALFGSVMRSDFRPDSDIDILISFAPDAQRGLLTLSRMKHELEDLLGRDVDLVSKGSIESSHNWIRRQEILSTAKVIYVAR